MIIKQLFDWIKENRRKTSFPYSDEVLLAEIVDCCENDSILCIHDNDAITGVVCWRLDVEKKMMHVMDILTTKPGVVKQMMQVFQLRFPGYQIEGYARGTRYRNFKNTTKLTNRL